MNVGRTMTMDVVSGKSVFSPSGKVVCRNVGQESILVPIRGNVGDLDFVYTLSPVAARIWSLLDGVRSVDGIVELICAEYDTERDTAAADTTRLLADLAEAELITRSS